jgi:hypothetical protein
MSRIAQGGAATLMTLALATGVGCGKGPEKLERAETFTWVAQPIAFSPPSARWERQGDNSGGTLGVRFILRGGGQVLSVAAYRLFAERDRRLALERLLSRRDSLSRREFLYELSLARARNEDPLSEREAETAMAINTWLDRAMTDYLAESPGFVQSDLEGAVRAAAAYQPTLDELLPRIRLRPERMQEPARWRIGYERDTTLAGHPAFASDDTLITPERPLLFRQIFWVVNGCAFNATYQGMAENLETFHRVVDSIRFPDETDAPPR